jgi:hypothetical protein
VAARRCINFSEPTSPPVKTKTIKSHKFFGKRLEPSLQFIKENHNHSGCFLKRATRGSPVQVPGWWVQVKALPAPRGTQAARRWRHLTAHTWVCGGSSDAPKRTPPLLSSRRASVTTPEAALERLSSPFSSSSPGRNYRKFGNSHDLVIS